MFGFDPLGLKQTHHLSQDANSFVETIREPYYEIAFHLFPNNKESSMCMSNEPI